MSKGSLWSYVLLPAVVIVLLVDYVLVRSAFDDLSTDAPLAYTFGQMLVSVPIVLGVTALGYHLYRQARRSALLSAAETVGRHPGPVLLYLRSFRDDGIRMWARATNGRSVVERIFPARFEEVLTDHMWRYGVVVCLGESEGEFPPMGAARDYPSRETWRQHVVEMMTRSSLIALVVGSTRNLDWELRKALELGLLAKLVLIFPKPTVFGLHGVTPGSLARRWSETRASLRAHGVEVPDAADLRKTRAISWPGADARPRMIVSSRSDDWSYEAALDCLAGSASLGGGGSEGDASRRAASADPLLSWCSTLIVVFSLSVWFAAT